MTTLMEETVAKIESLLGHKARVTLKEMKKDKRTFAVYVLGLKPGTPSYESYVRGEWTRHGRDKP